MANAAAKLFQAYMESREMKCQTLDEEGSVLRAGWKLDNTHMDILFFFDEDCKYVQLRGVKFLQVPDNKLEAMFKAVNECNHHYRFVKFVVDTDDKQVICKADAVIQLDSCADETFELMIRMTQIVDDAYPTLMKALWA